MNVFRTLLLFAILNSLAHLQVLNTPRNDNAYQNNLGNVSEGFFNALRNYLGVPGPQRGDYEQNNGIVDDRIARGIINTPEGVVDDERQRRRVYNPNIFNPQYDYDYHRRPYSSTRRGEDFQDPRYEDGPLLAVSNTQDRLADMLSQYSEGFGSATDGEGISGIPQNLMNYIRNLIPFSR